MLAQWLFQLYILTNEMESLGETASKPAIIIESGRRKRK